MGQSEPDEHDYEPDAEPSGLEPSDLEPEEFDPESLGPSPPDLSANAGNADPETSQLFWSMVLVFNVALLAGSLGLMFIVFQQRWSLGLQLTLAGLILFVYGYYRVRQFQSE